MILTVIGGGSSQWMITLMRDVYLLDEVDGGEIRLVDPKTEHVQAVAEMRAFLTNCAAKITKSRWLKIGAKP